MRVLVGYTNHIPQIVNGQALPGRETCGDSIIAFGAEYAQIAVTPEMAWADIIARCPGCWRPDVYIHWSPEYNPIPIGLESAECLTVGVWGDWNLGGQAMRAVSGLFDVLVADAVGCERLRGMGFENVIHGLLWAFDPAKHRRLSDADNGMRAYKGGAKPAPVRDIDILMIGNFNHAVQWERAPWLARVAALSACHKVMLTSGLYDDAYVQAMNRAKIVFNRSIRGEANMRAYEAPACGALMFYEAANREIHDIYTDREHCILYDETNLEELLAYYLAPQHESERQRVAQAGWEQAQRHSYAQHFADLLNQLEPLLAARNRSTDRLPVTQRQIALAAHWLLTCNVNVYHKADALLNELAAGTARGTGQANAIRQNNAVGQDNSAAARATIANVHAVLCGELAHCAASPAYKRQCAQAALRHARQAVHHAPDWLTARCNLAYLTLSAGNVAEAETLLRDAAARLDAALNLDGAGTGTENVPVLEVTASPSVVSDAIPCLDGPTFPRRFDWFDVASERLHGECALDSPEGRARMLALLSGRVHLTLAELAYGRGQFALSADHAERAARALPTIGEAQYALALALRAQGRSKEAVAAYRHTLALAPFHIAARDELGVLLLDTERAGEAVQSLDDWLAILNGCPVYADRRAHAELLRRQAIKQQREQQTRRAGANASTAAEDSAGEDITRQITQEAHQEATQATGQEAGREADQQAAPEGTSQRNALREQRLLALPNWSKPDSWRRVVRAFADAYTPADPVLLLLRADPTDCPDARKLLAQLEQFLTHDLKCPADALPNITLVHQPLVPADCWKLLRLADVVLSENLTDFWRGLAHSACVPILECHDLRRPGNTTD